MKRFIGAWKLVSVEDRRPDGAVSYPYGEGPAGLLVYDSSGYMSALIVRRDRAALSSDDWERVSAEEIKGAVEGVTAFFGSYEVNDEENTIVHYVEGHLLPNSVGKRLKRTFEFDGDRLILRPSATRTLIWRRMADREAS